MNYYLNLRFVYRHTGVVDVVNADGSFYAIEGNTSATSAGSQSNGGGVFRPLRYMSQVTKFIVPFEIVTEKGEEDMRAVAQEEVEAGKITQEEVDRLIGETE